MLQGGLQDPLRLDRGEFVQVGKERWSLRFSWSFADRRSRRSGDRLQTLSSGHCV